MDGSHPTFSLTHSLPNHAHHTQIKHRPSTTRGTSTTCWAGARRSTRGAAPPVPGFDPDSPAHKLIGWEPWVQGIVNDLKVGGQ